MGITSLLPLIEKSTRICNVREFKGETVAVDTYCWLHKGARGCAIELAKGTPTDSYVQYCLKLVKLLLCHNVKPIMVFDGRRLSAKEGTELKRRDAKKRAKQQGMEFLRLGQMDEAYKYFSQCVEVTPEMALNVIKECRKLNVDCIVAPYESDAQLAFFSIKNIAKCIISEDSDLLLFGCKKVLYKMDFHGNGQLVDTEKIHLSLNMNLEKYTLSKFRYMCIMAGCDYLDGLPGVGLKKALKFLKLTAETNPQLFLEKVPRYLNMRNLEITKDYIKNFQIADATFQHQIVFDPFQKKLVHLNPVEGNDQYCIKCGEFFDDNDAFELALGNLNPSTMKRISDWYPHQNIIKSSSIWSSVRESQSNNIITKPQKTDHTNTSRISNSSVEDLKDQCDKEIVEELKFYKSPTKKQSIKENSPTNKETTSPIINHYNPFSKSISKFKKISFNSEKTVSSRYFVNTTNTTEKELPLENPKDQCESEESKNETMNGDITQNNESLLCQADRVRRTVPKMATLRHLNMKRSAKQLTLEQTFKRFKK